MGCLCSKQVPGNLPEMAPHMAVELIETKQIEEPTITVAVVSTPMMQIYPTPVIEPAPVRVIVDSIEPPPVAVITVLPEPTPVIVSEEVRTIADPIHHIPGVLRKSYKSTVMEHYKWTIGLLPRPEDDYQKNKVDPRIAWGISHDHV